MARKRKTWKEAVKTSPGFADWSFGSNVRSLDRADQVAKAVSDVLKRIWNKYDRRIKARKFADRMWRKAQHVRDFGCKRPDTANVIPRDILAAMTWGVGDGHNRVMIARYEAAAKAADRFCRGR